MEIKVVSHPTHLVAEPIKNRVFECEYHISYLEIK